MNVINLDGLVTISEAIALVGYSPDYLRRMAREGTVKTQQIAGRWLFDRDDLLRYKGEMNALGRLKHRHRDDR